MALLLVVVAQKEQRVVPEAPCIPTMLAHAQARGKVTAPNPEGRAEMEGARVLRLRRVIRRLGHGVLVAEVPEFVITAAQKTLPVAMTLRLTPGVPGVLLAAAPGEAIPVAVRGHVLLLGRGAERQTPTEQAVAAAPVRQTHFSALEAVEGAVATLETPALQETPEQPPIQALQTVRP